MIKKTIITAAILAVAAVSGCAQNQKPVYNPDGTMQKCDVTTDGIW